MATSAPFSLTTSWQKIASAGDSIEVQCKSVQACVVVTSASAPSGGSNDGIVLNGGDREFFGNAPLAFDLYARALQGTGYVQVGALGTAAGGGGGGTVSQGSAGSSAWPVADSQLHTDLTQAGGLPVKTPIPASPVTGQKAITATGTAVQLGSNALVNGVVVKARATNTANIFVGGSSVTTTYDGTGSGFCLEPGAAASFAVANSNALWINGTAGDVVSFEGN